MPRATARGVLLPVSLRASIFGCANIDRAYYGQSEAKSNAKSNAWLELNALHTRLIVHFAQPPFGPPAVFGENSKKF